MMPSIISNRTKGDSVVKFVLFAVLIAGLRGQSTNAVVFDFEHDINDWQKEGKFQGRTNCGPYVTDVFAP
jgi:hypothetical protein